MDKLIVILGPTGSGKSKLAVKLAKKFKGEIVSADSRQIYQGLDIGTAKITKSEMAGIKHHLLDIVRPDQDFSLADYKKLALLAINEIHQKNKLPFLVGGTGLYIQAVADNLSIPKVAPDKRLRQKLEKELEAKGLPSLYNKLLKLDPLAKDIVDPGNPRRVIRALEVCLKTKTPFSGFYQKGPGLFDVLEIGLKIDRQQLYKKIDQRIDQMIKYGLVEEVKKLSQKYSFDLPAMSSIGYQESGQYLQGEIDLAEAVQKIKYRTHSYVRRQLTWFRKDKKIKWVTTQSEAEVLIDNFLND